MLGSATLEVAVGLALTFLLMSTVCTAVREGIESFLKTRAAYLEYGIRELLHDPKGDGLASALYTHPLIHGLYLGKYTPAPATDSPPIRAKGDNKPSYIPAQSFAIALMDIAARGPKTDALSSGPQALELSVAAIRANLLNLQNPAVQRVLLTALDASHGQLELVRANLEAWYDSSMDRVSGWYKRSTQVIIFAIALFGTVALNVDSIRIGQFLYREDAARAAIMARAEAVTKAGTAPEGLQPALKELASMRLPIGWAAAEPKSEAKAPAKSDGKANNPWLHGRDCLVAWGTTALGWLITAFAATLGAPFWFDILSKFMSIRSAVKPAKSEGEVLAAAPVRARALPGEAAAPISYAAQPQVALAPSTVLDDESDIDACGHHGDDEITEDKDLPAARGGVGA